MVLWEVGKMAGIDARIRRDIEYGVNVIESISESISTIFIYIIFSDIVR